MAKASKNTSGFKKDRKKKSGSVGKSCQNGRYYATARECEDANPGTVAKRCDRCRGFHPSTKHTKGGRARR